MLISAVLAVAWPASPGVEALSRAFWLHQAVSAAGSLVFLRWVVSLADRHARETRKVIPFPRRA